MRTNRLFAILASFFLSISLFAQDQGPFIRGGWWEIGVNGGVGFQISDVSPGFGYGAGLTLAKNVYYKPGGLVYFDFRGRLMYANSNGMDTDFKPINDALNGSYNPSLDYSSIGSVYHNYNTDHGELNLEGVLYFNRLRQKTDVLLSLFGGIGIDYANTKIDQSGPAGLYDYSSIQQISNSNEIPNALNAMRDGIYESQGEGFQNGGVLGIMPGFGVGLGYQFTPHWSIGLEHKVSLALGDQLEGYNGGGNPDFWNYSSINLRYKFDPRGTSPPEIIMIDPKGYSTTSNTPTAIVKARIKHISSVGNVSMLVNGLAYENFTYNGAKEEFLSAIPLRKGENKIELEAKNQFGSDSEMIIIKYDGNETAPSNPQLPVYNKPVVTITNPAKSPHSVEAESISINATISEVASEADIKIWVDGQKQEGFSYNPGTDYLFVAVPLKKGTNRIKIEAKNKKGTGIGQVTVIRTEAPIASNPPPGTGGADGTRNPIPNNPTDPNNNPTPTDPGNGRVPGKPQAPSNPNPTTPNPPGEMNIKSKPVVDISSPATNNSTTDKTSLSFRGTVQNVSSKENIGLKLNGTPVTNFNYSSTSGAVSANLTLRNGPNSIILAAFNSVGSDQANVTITYGQASAKKPVVEITTPTTSPFSVNANQYTVMAKIQNVSTSSNVLIYVNGTKVTNFNFNPSTGITSVNVPVENGDNTISITGENDAGQDNASVVLRKQEARMPSITVQSPKRNGVIVTDSKFTYVATVTGVNDRSGINLTFNGSPITSFNFAPATGKVSTNVTLKGGVNRFILRAQNDGGAKEETTELTLKVGTPPAITVTMPVRSPFTTTANSADINATIENVQRKDQVQMIVNGKANTGFTFIPGNGNLIARLSLKAGSNSILLKANTNDGADQKTITIIYEPKAIVPAPRITRTTPAKSPFITKRAKSAYKAKVTNVKDKANLQLSLNGNKVTNFTFSPLTGEVEATFTLNNGDNTILLKASNEGGAVEDKTIVTYSNEEVKLPEVKITRPNTDVTTIKIKSYNFEGLVTGVLNKNGIQLSVNGKNFTNFTYDPIYHKVKANLPLAVGTNVVKLKASNSGGQASEEVIINYLVGNVPIPVITVQNPSKNPFVAPSSDFTLQARIDGILSSKDVEIWLNDKKITATTYSSRNKIFTAKLRLNTGNNKVEIRAKNKAGSDRKVLKIDFGL